MDMYSYMETAKKCYGLLNDELSRKIFCERLICDVDPSPENVERLVSYSEQQAWLDGFLTDTAPNIQKYHGDRKVILYGTAVTGKAIAAQFLKREIGFYGFCGRRAKAFPNGLMGKPVIPPDELFSHMDDYCVIMAVTEAYNEVKAILAEHNFPQDQIIPLLRRDPGIPEYEIDHQYFEFPSLFRHNTAFIDGGSLDCRSSYLFAQWCGGEYSHIYAFEPDPISFDICEANLEKRPVRGLKLVQAGLSDRSGEVRFRSGLYNQSCIVNDAGSDDDGIVVVPLTTIDSTVGGGEILWAL